MSEKSRFTTAGTIVCFAMLFAIAVSSPLIKGAQEIGSELGARQEGNSSTKTAVTTANQVADFRAKRQSTGGRGDALMDQRDDCPSVSETNTKQIPSAFIVGTGMLWSDIDSINKKYNSSWMCTHKDAFVYGGMSFNYTEQKLYVPSCGIYEIQSQILFQRDHNSGALVHQSIQIKRDNSTDDRAEFVSYAGLVTNLDTSKTTTINLTTVKMCKGGSISVVVPSLNNCCAYGDGKLTHFSAKLISKVDCENICPERFASLHHKNSQQ